MKSFTLAFLAYTVVISSRAQDRLPAGRDADSSQRHLEDPCAFGDVALLKGGGRYVVLH